MTLRRPQMTPRRAKRSPRRAKVSSGRLPGAFWEGFPRHFQATRGDRDAPYSNRRRGRVAPEQGYRLALRLACFLSLPRDRARKLRKRRTRNSRLCLVVLCLGSSRRCLCSSPRLLRRLRCLRLSLLTRFPFLDSQVSFWGVSVFFEPLRFSKAATPSTRKPCFLRSGGSQNGAKMATKLLRKSSSGAGGLRESLGERFWEVLEGPKGSPEAPKSAPGAPGEPQQGKK